MQGSGYETVAAIDVGSNSMKMAIAQISKSGEITPLEDLVRPTHIGRDTFAYGRIQIDSIHDTCDTLKGFSRVMQAYKIKNYRAVCTSGIREAENREYVLEQIRLRTGLELEVINNAQERFFMYRAIKDFLPSVEKTTDRGTLIVDIRAGGVEVSVYSSGNLKFTEYIKVGSLRLREILADLERMTLDFPSIMEEFIESRIDFLKARFDNLTINNFIGLGGELRTIIKLCGDKEADFGYKYIKKKDLLKLYSSIHSMTTEQIIEEYGIERNQAEILLPSVILFYSFLKVTKADGIHAPMVSLRHGLLADIADSRLTISAKEASFSDIISSVWYIGEKYQIEKEHCEYIEKLALDIFDQTLKIHRLGERERFYLRVAAILHDIGKYVNLNRHDVHSYNIIRSQDIMGFSTRELSIVANVARYHSEDTPQFSDENYLVLGERDRMVVSKMAAILRMAESLDISHKRKITQLSINASGTELLFKISANEDTLLEEWSFAGNIEFFEEVMGVKPVFKRRRIG